MTAQCIEKTTCSFYGEKEVCLFCQTRLRGADRRLMEIIGREERYFDVGKKQNRGMEERYKYVRTF